MCPLLLEQRHPRGQWARACGLQTSALNGVEGVVAGPPHYSEERVGIQLPEPVGLKALRPRNIEIVRRRRRVRIQRAGTARCDALSDVAWPIPR